MYCIRFAFSWYCAVTWVGIWAHGGDLNSNACPPHRQEVPLSTLCSGILCFICRFCPHSNTLCCMNKGHEIVLKGCLSRSALCVASDQFWVYLSSQRKSDGLRFSSPVNLLRTISIENGLSWNENIILCAFSLFCIHFLFLFSDMVPLTGSLKRPVSLQPFSSHQRVLKSPLSSGLNPEGIYVWGSIAHLCCWER